VGENRFDAYLESRVESEGSWRFDFSNTPGFVAGSIRVEAGQVSSMDGYSVVFAVGPRAGHLRFSCDIQSE
jgi:hypothetical protein